MNTSTAVRITPRLPLWVGILFVLASLGCLQCLGQSTYSEILGAVTDPSGAAVAGAKVVVKSLDTNIPSPTTTDAEGRFRVRQLLLGNYEVAVEKSGFAKYIQGPITLRLNQNEIGRAHV